MGKDGATCEITPMDKVPEWMDLEGRVRSLEAAVLHMSGRFGSGAVAFGVPPLVPASGDGFRTRNAIVADLAAERAITAGLRLQLADADRKLDQSWTTLETNWQREIDNARSVSEGLLRDLSGTMAELERARERIHSLERGVPNGYVLVPRAATQEMLTAAGDAVSECIRTGAANGAGPLSSGWNAMVKAGELKR